MAYLSSKKKGLASATAPFNEWARVSAPFSALIHLAFYFGAFLCFASDKSYPRASEKKL